MKNMNKLVYLAICIVSASLAHSQIMLPVRTAPFWVTEKNSSDGTAWVYYYTEEGKMIHQEQLSKRFKLRKRSHQKALNDRLFLLRTGYNRGISTQQLSNAGFTAS